MQLLIQLCFAVTLLVTYARSGCAQGIRFDTYHELVIPLTDPTLRDQLQLDNDQLAVFEKLIREYEVDYPSFSPFSDPEKSFDELLGVVERQALRADKASQQFFDEALIPRQSDLLLARYMYRAGIFAFQHPALKERFKLTDDQLKSIRQATKRWKEMRIQAWSNLEKTQREFRKEGRSLAFYVDLRIATSISIAFPALTKEQVDEVKLLLDSQKAHSKMTYSLSLAPLSEEQ